MFIYRCITYTYIHVHICICLNIQIHMNICIYIDMYMHVYMYRYHATIIFLGFHMLGHTGFISSAVPWREALSEAIPYPQGRQVSRWSNDSMDGRKSIPWTALSTIELMGALSFRRPLMGALGARQGWAVGVCPAISGAPIHHIPTEPLDVLLPCKQPAGSRVLAEPSILASGCV